MSIDACKAAFRAAVAGITPTHAPHYDFTSSLTSTDGRRLRLEQLKAGFRHFEVVTAGLPQQPEGGQRSCRWVQPVNVRIRYDYTHDVDPLDTLVSTDIKAIVKALRTATNWNQTESQLTAVAFDEPLDPEYVGDEDDPSAVIITLPLTIRYKDC